MSAKAAFVVAVILASLPALASCGANARSGDGTDGSRADARAVTEQTTGERAVVETMSGGGAVARAGDAEARAGDGAFARAGDAVARAGAGAAARAGDAEARADADSEDASRKVALEIRGDRGTKFAGECSVGGDEKRIRGQVPESYSFELDGEKLECEIRKDGPGTLEVVLAAGDDVRSVHRQTGAGSSTINLTYSGNGVSSSTSQVGSIVSSATSSTESR